MGRTSKNSYTTRIGLIIGIIILINIISTRLFFRLDFTADNIYTLSNATREILRSLEEPVTVTAYFTEDIPPQLLQVRNDFRDMLAEYANVSRGNLAFEFVDPNKDPETERKAMQEGVMPSIVNVRERDQMTQKRVFFGAVLKLTDRKEVIPMVQSGTAMEFELSTAIKKLSVSDRTLIGYLQGHGEPSRGALQQVMAELGLLHSVVDVDLGKSSDDLSKYKTILVVRPTDTVPPAHLARLDDYLVRGGNLVLALNRVDGNFSTLQGTTISTGFEDWLAGKGLTLENSFLIDASCGSVGVQQQSGFMTFTTNINFPYLPVLHQFSDHPVSKGLEQVLLTFASPLSFNSSSPYRFTPLAFSSDKSGTQSPPLFFAVDRKWSDSDFPLARQVVAALLEPATGGAGSRIIVIGDGDFPVNGEGQRPQPLQPDNVNLFVNATEWLSDQSGLAELRTKAITARPLDNIDEGRKNTLKWLNFLLPIILIIGYGIFRNRQSRRLRIKRMEEGYV